MPIYCYCAIHENGLEGFDTVSLAEGGLLTAERLYLIRGMLFLSMPIAYLKLELRIEAAHSLKDKRQVVRSLKDRLRNSFNISIAEIEVSDLWQRATLGAVSISDSRDYLEGLMRNVEREAVRLANNNGAEVVDSFVDFLES